MSACVQAGHIAVIDIGKTNAKLAVVDTVQMHEVGVLLAACDVWQSS